MLAEKKTPLPREVIEKKCADFPQWVISEDGAWLTRRYGFKNFKLALAFVNAVGVLAEAQRHHPDITLGWGYVTLAVQTHEAGGITEQDFQLVEAIATVEASA
jgi:4a-hydroxytetrahydrobiopterin dehydratase